MFCLSKLLQLFGVIIHWLFWGGGVEFKVWTFLSVVNSCTESLYRKMNNIFVMYSCCSIFTKQLIFSSSNFVINESNNPDKKYRKMTLLFIFWCQLLVFLIQLALVYSLYHWFPSLHSRQFLCSVFHCHSQSKRSVWACWKLNFSQIRKGEGRGWGLEGREMNCLFSSPWVFFIHHLPVFSPFLPLIVLRTRTDILSFVYFLQIIIASHIHAIYNHSLEERRRVEPGNTPVKKRTSSQSQVQLLSKQSFFLLIIWSTCIQLTYDIFFM